MQFWDISGQMVKSGKVMSIDIVLIIENVWHVALTRGGTSGTIYDRNIMERSLQKHVKNKRSGLH